MQQLMNIAQSHLHAITMWPVRKELLEVMKNNLRVK